MMKRAIVALATFFSTGIVSGAGGGGGAGAFPAAPATPKRPVVDVRHGVRVVDDYRWLEAGADPEVRAWSAAQNARARAYLDALPSVPSLKKQLGEIERATSPEWIGAIARGGRLFALKRQPPLQQPLLVTLASADD